MEKRVRTDGYARIKSNNKFAFWLTLVFKKEQFVIKHSNNTCRLSFYSQKTTDNSKELEKKT